MICSSCGQQNRQNSRFCSKCGAHLPQGNLPTGLTSMQQPTSSGIAGPGGVGWQPNLPNNQLLSSSPFKPTVTTGALSSTALQPSQDGTFEGEAHDIQSRQEPSIYGNNQYVQIWTFRLEKYDKNANRQQLSVEMRGQSIVGRIYEGHQVKVFGKLENGELRAKRVEDKNTGGNLEVKEGMQTTAILIVAVSVFVIVVISAIIVFSTISKSPSSGVGSVPSNVPTIPSGPSGKNSPKHVLEDYCLYIRTGSYSEAYDEYSAKLKNQVTSAQLQQMWLSKHIDTCTHDTIQITGNTGTTTISAHEAFTDQIRSYSVRLTQDSNGAWKIDDLQPQ